MAGVSHGNLPAVAGELVIEAEKSPVGLSYGDFDGDLLVIMSRVQITAVRFDNRQQYAVLALHVLVPKTGGFTHFRTPHLHPDEVVGVVHHAHLVGLGIANPDVRSVSQHGNRIVPGMPGLSVKLLGSSRAMQIKVLFFGLLKDLCGRAEDRLELPEGAHARAVFDHYAAQFPALRGMAGSIVLARNHEFAHAGEALAEGDEVALLPPVSGGSHLAEITHAEGHFFALTRAPIDARAVEARILQGFDGAIVTFQGVVRNNTRGRETLRLEYECYEGMAIRKIAEIGHDLARNLAISRIAMVHRLGMMEIGEASVLVVAAAPHRRPAFDAALEGINRLKRLVPIWKKEFFADGEVWVEGEWDENAPRIAPG
jgi:molybdopterin converting factor subunit 1